MFDTCVPRHACACAPQGKRRHEFLLQRGLPVSSLGPLWALIALGDGVSPAERNSPAGQRGGTAAPSRWRAALRAASMDAIGWAPGVGEPSWLSARLRMPLWEWRRCLPGCLGGRTSGVGAQNSRGSGHARRDD